MGFFGNMQVLLQVCACERAQQTPIHQVCVEELGVLGQPYVTQPCLRHPVVVQIRCFGQSENSS